MPNLKLRCAASFKSVTLVASVRGDVIERAPDVKCLRFDYSTGIAGSEGPASTVRIGPFPRMPSCPALTFAKTPITDSSFKLGWRIGQKTPGTDGLFPLPHDQLTTGGMRGIGPNVNDHQDLPDCTERAQPICAAITVHDTPATS